MTTHPKGKRPRPAAAVTGVHPAGPNHQVLTVTTPDGGRYAYVRSPCAQCPWRRDLPTKVFPAEAFRHSARCAEDLAMTTFACHMTGTKRPATCAGFILSDDAPHNLMLRMKAHSGALDFRNVKPLPGVETFRTYSDMAVANGVKLNDPTLIATRSRREAGYGRR